MYPPFTHASAGTVTHLKEVYIKIETDTGICGWGEVRGNCEYVTGDTPEKVAAVLEKVYSPALLGKPACKRNEINRCLDNLIQGNHAARAAIDIALIDLAGKALKVSASDLLGGRTREALPSDATIAFGSPEEAEEEASAYLAKGFRTIKLRVGLDPSTDIERAKRIKRVIDSKGLTNKVLFCIDANQGWTTKEAVQRLEGLKDSGIAWAEQPVAAHNLAGMKEIKQHTQLAIVADVSCHSPEDVARIAAEGIADVVHLKLVKAGTIQNLLKMIAIAESFHLPYMLGQMDEGRLATAGLVHIASTTKTEHFEVACFQRVREEDDPAKGLILADGSVVVPNGHGLGIEVDESALQLISSLSNT